MPSSSKSTEPYLLIEKCGQLRGEPVYVITKYIPSKGDYGPKTQQIRCMDLGKEAIGNYKAEEGGCTQIQFLNGVSDLRCAKCGMEFSKFYLRRELYIEIRGIPD